MKQVTFPYYCGYDFGEGCILKKYPHFYTAVSYCGAVYGHLIGFVFKFDGFEVTKFSI